MSQASEYAANVSRILQQKGDAIAEGKRRSGAIIGNTVATLGQVIPQQVQEAMKASAMKNLAKQHVGDLDGYITALEGIDPATALDLRKKKADADKIVAERTIAERTNKQKALEQFRDDLNTVKTPEDYTRLHYVYTQVYGPDALKGAPTEFDQGFVDQMRNRTEAELEALKPKPKQALMNLGGGAVYDPNTLTDVRQAQLTPDQQADNARMAQAEARAQQAEERTGAYQQAQLGISRGQLDVARQNARTNAARAAQSDGGGAAGPSGIPKEYELALRGVTIDLPAIRRDNLNKVAKMAYEQGGEKALAEVVRRAAIDTEPVAARTQILGRRETLQSLDDAAVILKQLKDKGVSTGILRGTVEDVARKLGTSTNPELARLATRLRNTEVNYRRSITGAQFGEKEAADYAKMFPNYSNTLPVNLSLIEGLRDAMGSYDKAYWTHKLGNLGVMSGAATPQGKSPSGPKNDPMGIR